MNEDTKDSTQHTDKIEGPTKTESKPDTMVVLLKKDATQDEKIAKRKRFCREIKPKLQEIMGDKYHAINEVGTPLENGGNDHDIRIFTNLDLTDDERQKVLEAINGYGLNSEVFFSDKEEFLKGGFKEAETAKGSGEFIAEKGYDPETASIVLGDDDEYYSALVIYLAASMRDFDDDGNTAPSEIGEKTLENIVLTQKGGVGFANLFTAEFIRDYIRSNSKNEDEALPDSKLGKYMVRTKLGKLIAQTNPNDLPQLKNEYIEAVKTALANGINPDENLAKLIVKHDKTLNSKEKEMILLAGKLRTTKEDGGEDFRKFAKESILTDSALLNVDKRHGNEEASRALSGYLMVESFKTLSDDKSKVVYGTLDPNTTLTTQGESNDKLYYIPFNKTDGTPNGSTEVNSSGKVRELSRGRFVGVFQALSEEDKNATATVTTKEETEILTIEGEFIRSILHDPTLAAEILSGNLVTNEARALHILLTQLPYNMIQTLGEITPYTSSPNPVDTHQNMKNGNPLREFYDETLFSSIIITQTEKCKNDDNPPFVYKRWGEIKDEKDADNLYKKGDSANGKFYFIVEGGVEIEAVGKTNGVVKTDIFLGPGFTIGEKALHDADATRSASVRVADNTILIEIDADEFLKLAYSNIKVEHKGADEVTSAFLLYHLAALTTGRVLQRLY